MAALRQSRRSLFIMQEIRKVGQDFGMPKESEDVDLEASWWYADVELPLTKELVAAKGDAGFADTGRFKNLIIHVHVQTGVYTGGVFRLDIDLRNAPDYPNEPPKAKLLTKIWHPNVKVDGTICHSHLRLPNNLANPGTWSPMLRINTLIHGLVAMFDINDSAFNPFSPLNPEAAEQYCNDKDGFIVKAKEWVGLYAKPVEIDELNLVSTK